MKNIAVACKTLQDEIMFVIRDLGIQYPVLWIESMQHNNPRQLKECIQQQINLIGNVDNIILLFGNCGNAIQGLSSRESSIVFPRVDDCISLFLGGNRQKKELDSKGSAYYLTRGYLEGESNIWSEYLYCVSKYGEEKARKLMGIILKTMKTERYRYGSLHAGRYTGTYQRNSRRAGAAAHGCPGFFAPFI